MEIIKEYKDTKHTNDIKIYKYVKYEMNVNNVETTRILIPFID